MRQQSTLSSSYPQLPYRLLLAFGSNIGNREQNLICALDYIKKFSTVICSSLWKKTQPLKSSYYNTSNHEYYLNFVIDVATNFNPYEFYKLVIIKIEDTIGHSRHAKWMPRSLDIDVVFAAKNDAVSFTDCTPIALQEEDFFVPHLEYFNRDFWREMIEVDLNYVPKR